MHGQAKLYAKLLLVESWMVNTVYLAHKVIGSPLQSQKINHQSIDR